MSANLPAELTKLQKERELLKQLVGRYFISGKSLYYVEDIMFNAQGVLVEDCSSGKSVWIDISQFKRNKKQLLKFQAVRKEVTNA
jgi:hypothetical protein